jgi:predicted ATPase
MPRPGARAALFDTLDVGAANPELMVNLKKLLVRGYKSLRDVEIDFGPRTVLIGPNGAGKSNLLGVLQLVAKLATRSLTNTVVAAGGASALLYRGPKVTPEMELHLWFEREGGAAEYRYLCRLGRTADDNFFFLEEKAGVLDEYTTSFVWKDLGSGHRESALWDAPDPSAKGVRDALERINYFHFHDTSVNAPLRVQSRVEESKYLRPDGVNLAAFLLALKEADDDDSQAAWRRILGAMRQVAPFLKDLSPTLVAGRHVRLDWVDDVDDTYGVYQLSDGTLRALALFTALSQPGHQMPAFVSIDEPELGLHPAALDVLVGAIRSVEGRCQVLLATQSTRLLDYFEPEEVLVTERSQAGSVYRRVDREKLQAWLDEYTLSELFDRNLLGGRP